MPTFLFDAHVFGPISSRRLGSSLGINLLSTKEKICNFDCIYCECGSLSDEKKQSDRFVDQYELILSLVQNLATCLSEKIPVDTITFAGNGEPTLHPDFPEIISRVIPLRDKFFPEAKIAVLTNGMTLKNREIRYALEKIDKTIVKLDAGSDEAITLIDRPQKWQSIDRFKQELSQFEGPLTIQTMFLRGNINGEPIDNASPEALENWFNQLIDIMPSEVMLYSLDRDTPIQTIEKVQKKELEIIAEQVNQLGIQTMVV